MIVIMLLALQLNLTPIAIPTIPSPTPIPSSTPAPIPTTFIPVDNVINSLATVESQLRTLEAQPTAPIPEEDASQLFAFAKWALEPDSLEEMVGPFAPPLLHIATAIEIVVTFGAIIGTIILVVLLIRFIIWLVDIVLRFIPFM